MADRVDLVLDQGTGPSGWEITLTDFDLTGTTWTGRMQVRPSVGSATVLAEIVPTVDVGTGLGSGVVSVSIDPATSSGWSWNEGVYDIEIQDDADPTRIIRVCQGTITLDLEVTR